MFGRVVSFLKSRAGRSGAGLVPLVATYADYKQFSSQLSQRPAQSIDDPAGRRYLAQVEAEGICIIPDYWDAQKCAQAREEVDRVTRQYPAYLHPNAQADLRIYGAENASPLIAQFARDPMLSAVATAYNREPTRTAFTLAAKLPAQEGNKGSGEGWHRDAFLRQFKAILYLVDVDQDCGPLQLLRDSHRAREVLRDIWRGRLRYMQYRLSDAEVERILRGSPDRLMTCTAKAGTLILVNTSAIHRGMPIKAGVRYALTNYYFPERHIDAALLKKFMVLPTPAVSGGV